MEMSYLYLGLLLLREQLGIGYLAFALILALYPLSFLVGLAPARWPGGVGRGSKLGAGLGISLLLVVGALVVGQVLSAGTPIADADVFEFVVEIGACGLSWWLGRSLVRDEISYHFVCFRFQVGILALVVLTIIEGQVLLPVFLFLVMAVFALALARQASSVQRCTGVLRPLSAWRFLAGALGALGLAALVFAVLSPDAARGMLLWIGTAAASALRLAGVNLAPPAPDAPVEFNFSCARTPLPGEKAPDPPAGPSGPEAATSPIVLWAIIVGIFVAVVLGIWLTARSLKARRQFAAAGATGVDIRAIPASMFGGLTGWLRSVVRRLGRVWRWALAALGRGRAGGSGVVTPGGPVASVRALYRGLLDWGARAGCPREPSATPLEYLQVLCQRFPGQREGLALITDVYVRARYSRSAQTKGELGAATAAWHRIESGARSTPVSVNRGFFGG